MIGWLDAQAGASGDMLLGALVDVGVPLPVLQADLDQLDLGLTLTAEPVARAGLAATRVQVLVDGHPADVASTSAGHTGSEVARAPQRSPQPRRTWADVRGLLGALEHPAHPLEVFRRLAEAEAAVHRTSPDEVHFHEVGALDALGDVVGVCAGFRHLGLERLTCSRVSLGSGTTRGAHGPLPVPAPAVLRLLDGVPVQAGPAPFESTTPTGAALLATLVDDWGPVPPMTLGRTGAGAGSRDSEHVCNALRLVLGTAAAAPTTEHLLEANVDDLDPRLWPAVLDALLGAGAVDAWLTPILMKKGRPAHTVSALVPEAALPAVRAVVFRETTSIGLRETAVAKHALVRTFTAVEVGGQSIAVKHAWYDGQLVTSTPEWEDVARAAGRLGLPAHEVLLLAQTSAKNANAPAPPARGTPTQS